MRFVGAVGSEILGNRVGTIHPGFYNRPRHTWSYERRQSSCAYIPTNEGIHYFAGGFVGGSTQEFLHMSCIISEWRQKDLRNGIVPVWHDESLLNKYYLVTPPDTVLDPSYCHPEKWKTGFTPRIVALDKNHKEMRQ